MKKALQVLLLSTFILACVFYLATVKINPSDHHISHRHALVNSGKNLHAAIMAYTQDHEGQFPKASTHQELLEKLADSKLLDSKDIPELRKGWAYVSGLTFSSPLHTPLLFSTSAATSSRPCHVIVIHVDGSSSVFEILEDGTYLDIVTKTSIPNPFAPDNLPKGTIVLSP